MKTPTRFERMVTMIERGSLHQYASSMSKANAVKLLTREHQAVVRKVKAMRKPETGSYYVIHYNKACDDLLAWLDRRAR